MFIGHFGAGLAGKNIDRRPSLGTLFFATQFIDLLWPLFLLLGIEKVIVEPGISEVTPMNFTYYPFSHSLLGVLIWAVIFGAVYFLIKKRLKTSLLLAFLVLSHWLLDLIVHIPDLPITFTNEAKVGLGIWNSFFLTILIEGFIFAGGIILYFKATEPKNKKGFYGLWGLIIFLSLVYIMNLFGDPPPNDQNVIGYVGLSQWLIVWWGYWIDKNRENL